MYDLQKKAFQTHSKDASMVLFMITQDLSVLLTHQMPIRKDYCLGRFLCHMTVYLLKWISIETIGKMETIAAQCSSGMTKFKFS